MFEIINYDKRYPEVHIFFICYNKLWFTRQTLKNILKTKYHKLFLHIFNNGSIDNGETSEFFEDFLTVKDKISFPVDYLKLEKASSIIDLRFKFLKTFQLIYPNFNFVAEVHNNLDITDPDWLTKMMDLLQSTDKCCLVQSFEALRNKKNFKAGNGILYESKNPIIIKNFLSSIPKNFNWDGFIKGKLNSNYILSKFSSMSLLDNLNTNLYQKEIKQFVETSPVTQKPSFKNKVKNSKRRKMVKHFFSETKVKPRKIPRDKFKSLANKKIKKSKKIIKKVPKREIKGTEIIKVQPKIWRKMNDGK